MPQPEPTIANYDDRTADEISRRLRKLSQADLAELEAYERQGEGRKTVLETIAALRGDEPWSGYDDMEVEEVNNVLKRRDGDAAGRVLDYERQHKARKTVIEFARARQQEPRARKRSQSTKSNSRSKPGASKRSSGSSSRARAKTTSRPSATRSSGSQRSKGSQGRSRPRSQSKAAGRSPTQSGRTSATPARQSESRAKEALQAAAAKLGERATEALRNAEGPAKKLAKDTGVAVGSAAHKAKTPALLGAATLATVGGAIAVGAKVRQRRRPQVLGVSVPRRSAVGKAAKRVGEAVDGVTSTGHQIGAWSDDLQYLRQRVAGGDGSIDQLLRGGSALSEMLEGESRAGRKKAARGRRGS